VTNGHCRAQSFDGYASCVYFGRWSLLFGMQMFQPRVEQWFLCEFHGGSFPVGFLT
jgi:hypothetical protein